jgi:hypothetical protein
MVVETCAIAILRIDIRSGIDAMLKLEISMQQCPLYTIRGIMKTAYDDICANVLSNVRRFASYAQEHAIDREIAFLVGDMAFAPETVCKDTRPEYKMQFEGRRWASYLTQTRELLCNCLRYEDHTDLYVYYMHDATPTFMERAETEGRELDASRFLSIRENIQRVSGVLSQTEVNEMISVRIATRYRPIDSYLSAFMDQQEDDVDHHLHEEPVADLEISSAAVPIAWTIDRVGDGGGHLHV